MYVLSAKFTEDVFEFSAMRLADVFGHMNAWIKYLRDQLRYPWIICCDRAPTSHVAQFPIDAVDLDQSPCARSAFIRVTEMRLYLEDFNLVNIEAMSRRNRANDYGCQVGYLGPATPVVGTRRFTEHHFVVAMLREDVICSDSGATFRGILDGEALRSKNGRSDVSMGRQDL